MAEVPGLAGLNQLAAASALASPASTTWASRFRRALDRGNATEALLAAGELQFVGLAEALELTLLLADADQEKYERAAVRWHVRFVYESKNVGIRESQAVLALLAAIPVNSLAATALAELLSRRRGFERPCETLVAWARQA